jgi:hypothetical protein
MADIGLTKAFKMRDAIEKKAKKGLAEEGYAETSTLVNAAMLGIYEVLLSYLPEDQIDKIIKAHKLEL